MFVGAKRVRQKVLYDRNSAWKQSHHFPASEKRSVQNEWKTTETSTDLKGLCLIVMFIMSFQLIPILAV